MLPTLGANFSKPGKEWTAGDIWGSLVGPACEYWEWRVCLDPFLGIWPTGELDYAASLSTLLTFLPKGILKILVVSGILHRLPECLKPRELCIISAFNTPPLVSSTNISCALSYQPRTFVAILKSFSPSFWMMSSFWRDWSLNSSYDLASLFICATHAPS